MSVNIHIICVATNGELGAAMNHRLNLCVIKTNEPAVWPEEHLLFLRALDVLGAEKRHMTLCPRPVSRCKWRLHSSVVVWIWVRSGKEEVYLFATHHTDHCPLEVFLAAFCCTRSFCTLNIPYYTHFQFSFCYPALQRNSLAQ